MQIRYNHAAGAESKTLDAATSLMPGRRYRGFTIVEALVVIAILGILVALVIPAVQSARESSRKSQCLSRLRQIGLAVGSYHDAHGCFPPSAIVASQDVANETFERFDGFGWQVMLLPYLDMSPLYEQIAPDGRFGVFRRHFEETRLPYPGCETIIPLYRCPSSAMPSHTINAGPLALPDYRHGYALTDYAASYGGGPRGVILWGEVVRLQNITDGASKTLLAGESSYPGPLGQDWPTWAGYLGSPATAIFITREGHTINCGMKGRGGQFWIDAHYDMCATSYHPGGAQFVFADGHARFLAETIDSVVYKYLGGRDDGRPVSDF